ncbi:hypothetical protein AND4_06829 [Vibrio sp. AND4]|nr:hypothetical protein AND4_06829 [Vibrio sp. AND4]
MGKNVVKHCFDAKEVIGCFMYMLIDEIDIVKQ